MMIILIENLYNYHYEILETLIVDYNKIIPNISNKDVTIYLVISKNNSFETYIKSKYPKIIFGIPKIFDYHISATIYNYDDDYKKIFKNSKRYFYISHHVSDRLQKLSNVYYLTPIGNKYLYADKLPFNEISYKKPSNVPIYIIQGGLNVRRRHYKLLEKILEKKYEYDFIIKLVGRGYLPPQLKKYSNKIIVRNNLNFIDYHKEFLNAYCILPLVTKKTNPKYYVQKLTSTISYCIGYNLKCLIDKDLQNIYNLKDVEVFNNENDIAESFKNTLVEFYNNKQKKSIS